MTRTNSLVRQFNVVLLGNLVAGGSTSPGVNKYEATLTAYMPGTFTIYLFVPHLQVLFPSLGVPLARSSEREGEVEGVQRYAVA